MPEHLCSRCRTALMPDEAGRDVCRACAKELWFRARAILLREIRYPKVVAEDYLGRLN